MFVTYVQKRPKIDFRLDGKKMLRIHYCNTGFHQIILIGCIIIFQMFCFFQAFRGRHLPGPMNDVMSMVYAILIASVTFAVSFPISYFQGIEAAEFVQILVSLLNSFCFVVFLYGKKCFIILFKPHKNTKEYFDRQRMIEMSAQAGLQSQFSAS